MIKHLINKLVCLVWGHNYTEICVRYEAYQGPYIVTDETPELSGDFINQCERCKKELV